MSRIYSIRVNLDIIAADLDMWSTDQERSAWLRGFMVGARGADCRWQIPSPEAAGHAVGAAGHADSMAWVRRQSDAGKLSAEKRKVNHGSTTVQPRFEPEVNHGSTTVRTEGQPNQSTNQPINESTTQPSTNQRKDMADKSAAVRPRFVPPTVEQVEDYCDESGHDIDAAAFVAYYESKGWVVGKSKMVSWQAAARGWASRDKKNRNRSGDQEQDLTKGRTLYPTITPLTTDQLQFALELDAKIAAEEAQAKHDGR
jgi:hypothetical protein